MNIDNGLITLILFFFFIVVPTVYSTVTAKDRVSSRKLRRHLKQVGRRLGDNPQVREIELKREELLFRLQEATRRIDMSKPVNDVKYDVFLYPAYGAIDLSNPWKFEAIEHDATIFMRRSGIEENEVQKVAEAFTKIEEKIFELRKAIEKADSTIEGRLIVAAHKRYFRKD